MLEVLEASGLVTVQDLGRVGWRRFGVPSSGPMDMFAFQAANLLAGNAPRLAALEVGGGEVVLRATEDCVIAAAGAGYSLTVNIWEYPLWGSYFMRRGWAIRLSQNGFGMWAYLAIAGGVQAATVLGSRSTYLPGHFGGLEGRSLQAGDILRGAATAHMLMEAAGQTLPAQARPAYGEEPTVEVIAGLQRERFTDESVETLTSSSYQVGLSSDRMGYRLQGPPLVQRDRMELPSEGMAPGAIQVPPDGAPIVMMADCATTGGYAKIACVVSADLPLLAQCTPGKDRTRFRQTSVEAAQQRHWEMQQRLLESIVEAEGD